MAGVHEFFTDGMLETINRKFTYKKEIARGRHHELFDVFGEEMTPEEETLLKFLYAYMPLHDLGDCKGDFFLKNVRDKLTIREKVSWGYIVPDELFIYYVLPYRINNENIEDYTMDLFGQLYEKVRGLSMYDAVLEINHWCYQKATYIACDPRTSSPYTVMRRALGRCGEETVLAAAALRSLCIPGRQCYTPKWAHSDSNHAWAEAWADGKWYFFGACEPDPRLDRGWFKEPARRAMLINTRVAADYIGTEEVTIAHEWFTELNLLRKYAPCRDIKVYVKKEDGSPAEGASVHFQVYNYGSFSNITMLNTDKDGCVSLTTGYGDILLHAVLDKAWCSEKIDIRTADYFTLYLSDAPPEEGVSEFDMIPPAQTQGDSVQLSPEEISENSRRSNDDILVRKAYEDTFIKKAGSDAVAKRLSLPCDRVWGMLEKARGNSHEIAAFLEEAMPEHRMTALTMLETLAEKDLTDTFRPVLNDHLYNSIQYKDDYGEDIFNRYILCPRAGHEMIRAYRKPFLDSFAEKDRNEFRKDPQVLGGWIRDNIISTEPFTFLASPMSPLGCFELKAAEPSSKDILFVTLARSFGIPARLEPADKRPQFLHNGSWKDADLKAEGKEERILFDIERHNAKLSIINDDSSDEKAGYQVNFSLARFDERLFKTLDYRRTDMSVLEDSLDLLPGIYRLVSGTRRNDGSVMVSSVIFRLEPGGSSEVHLNFRKEENDLPVIGRVTGKIDLSYIDNGDKQEAVFSPFGTALMWIDPEREPSKHLLRELCELSQETAKMKSRLVILIGGDKYVSGLERSISENLPANIRICLDNGYGNLDAVDPEGAVKAGADLPSIYIIDGDGSIRYSSFGYKLGKGTEIIKALKAIK